MSIDRGGHDRRDDKREDAYFDRVDQAQDECRSFPVADEAEAVRFGADRWRWTVNNAPPDEVEDGPEEADELPPITAGDIAHTVERPVAGKESGEYTGMRDTDLVILWRVGQLGQERLDAVRRDPALLPSLVTPTAHGRVPHARLHDRVHG